MSQEPPEESHIKRMADLMRQGATLTELSCPACVSPLFRFKSGDLWCAKCEKRVVVVRRNEELEGTTNPKVLDTLETTLLTKIQEMQNKLQHEENIEKLQKLSTAISKLLENLEQIRKIKKH